MRSRTREQTPQHADDVVMMSEAIAQLLCHDCRLCEHQCDAEFAKRCARAACAHCCHSSTALDSEHDA